MYSASVMEMMTDVGLGWKQGQPRAALEVDCTVDSGVHCCLIKSLLYSLQAQQCAVCSVQRAVFSVPC